jgi:hypothetical protein
MAKTKATEQVNPETLDWSVPAIIKALRAGRTGDRLAALKRSGIITKSGKLAAKYRSWGKKVSRTPDAKEMGIVGVTRD